MSSAKPAPSSSRSTTSRVVWRVLLDGGAKAAGRQVMPWDGRSRDDMTPAGVYFVRLTVGARVAAQKLVLAP